ncbi:MAG: diguanylate cyclase (GGDEF)-like protein [Candidatus Azotimanducaceae bacterium]
MVFTSWRGFHFEYMLKLKGRSPEEHIILIASAICLTGQVPFGLVRLSRGDWIIAMIDLIGALLCATAIYQVYRHHRVGLFGTIMSVAAVLGVSAIISLGGVEDVHFIYPVVIVSHFLMPPRHALWLSIFAVLGITALLSAELSHFYLAKIGISILGCTSFAYAFASLRNRQNLKLLQLSTRDALTNVFNRRSLDEKLSEFVLQVNRQPADAALVLLDLDNFKKINDEEGHAAGDEVLQRVAKTIQQRIRVTDSLYRYGGDEFVVFAADTNIEQVVGLAEDLRSRVEATEAMEGSQVSISLGVAAYEAGNTVTDWLLSADTALLKAKRSGRNKVVVRVAKA